MAQYKGAASEANRAMQMQKRRDKAKNQMEELKAKIVNENQIRSNIADKFSSHYDSTEAQYKSTTVGLLTLNQMKEKQEQLQLEREKQVAMKKINQKNTKKNKKKEKRKQQGALSFNFDEGLEDVEDNKAACKKDFKKKKMMKNPDVDTSFLPDREREAEDNRLREKFRQEWKQAQENMKKEEIQITYSYWDGSGHRKKIKMVKGNSIQQFLMKCLEQLRSEFSELKSAGVEHLMYVKEDLIMPQHYTFYDFIITKARGKSGPLFNFDVHDDVRMLGDATVEKDESHAGKVVLRQWYEKNKHIFPASRWEPFDPEKKWKKFTIKDK